MASNRYFLFIFITGLFLIVPASLRAQDRDSYAEPHFVQRLTWVGDEYAMRYEVIIEKEEDGKYKRVFQEFTTAFFIEVSLSSGKYRFQVIPYDLLNLPVPVTEWMEFEVHRDVTKDQPDNDVPSENPDETESKNEIIVQNPEQETTIVNNKPFAIYLGLAWMPILSVYGENYFLGEDMTPYGAGLRLAIVPAKRDFLNPGMEGIASWRVFRGDPPVQSLTFDLNFIACFSDGKTAINSKIGAGVSLRPDAGTVPAAGQYALHANFGVSFLWMLSKRLYLETGMEYIQFFNNYGYLRPSAGLGYKF